MVSCQRLGDARLLGQLVGVDDRQMPVLDTERSGEVGMVGMVADHHRDRDGEVAAALAMEQIVEAVRLPRDEHGDTGSFVGEAQRPAHLELLEHGRGDGGDLVTSEAEAVELELDALEEGAVGVIGVLLEVDDVAALRSDERCERGDDAAAIRAGDEQHCVGHRSTLRPEFPSAPECPRVWAVPTHDSAPQGVLPHSGQSACCCADARRRAACRRARAARTRAKVALTSSRLTSSRLAAGAVGDLRAQPHWPSLRNVS